MGKALQTLVLACLLTLPSLAGETSKLIASRITSSAAVVPGQWHGGFTKAKQYADKNGLPFIAVWSNGDGCPHCVKFASSANSSTFKNWMKTSGVVFFFGCSSDKSYPVGCSAFEWCRKSTKTAYPFVRIWWKKKGIDISTVGDTVDGYYGGSTGGKKAVSYFKSKLKLVTSATTGTVKSYKIVFNANGGTGTMAAKSAVIGKSLSLPANAFKRTDCSFLGWAKSATGSVKYLNKDPVKDLSKEHGTEVHLYAKWRRTTFRTYYVGKKMSVAMSGLKGYSLSTSVSGLKWNSTKYTLSGTPKKAGTFTLKFKKGLKSQTRKIVIATDSIVLADTSFVGAVIGEGEALDVNLSPTAVSGPLQSVTVTGLPDGITYSDGHLAGCSTQVGTFPLTISGVTAAGRKLSKTVSLTIGVPEKLIGTFNGFVGLGEDPDSLVTNRGSLKVTASSAAVLSAKIITAKGTYSLSGRGWTIRGNGRYTAALLSSDGKHALDLALDTTDTTSELELTGDFTPSYGTVYTAVAQRMVAPPEEAVGTWYFSGTKISSRWIMSYGTSKSKDLTLKVAADGTATLAGTLGSYTISASSAVLVFAAETEDGFVRADFPVPVKVSGVKKTLDIWLNLWFDRSNDHLTERGDGIGAAAVKAFN